MLNKKGQMSLLFMMAIAVGLIFMAMTMNWNRMAQTKTNNQVAATSAAAKLAGNLASYGNNLMQTQLGGLAAKCDYTDVLTSIITLIILIIVLVIVAVFTVGAGGYVVGAFIAAMIISVVCAAAMVIIQATVITPSITRMWNKMQCLISTVEDRLLEQTLQSGMQGTVTDQEKVADFLGMNMDGRWNLPGDSRSTPDAKISRLALFYTLRLMSMNQINASSADRFGAELSALLQDTGMSGVGCAGAGANFSNPDCALQKPPVKKTIDPATGSMRYAPVAIFEQPYLNADCNSRPYPGYPFSYDPLFCSRLNAPDKLVGVLGWDDPNPATEKLPDNSYVVGNRGVPEQSSSGFRAQDSEGVLFPLLWRLKANNIKVSAPDADVPLWDPADAAGGDFCPGFPGHSLWRPGQDLFCQNTDLSVPHYANCPKNRLLNGAMGCTVGSSTTDPGTSNGCSCPQSDYKSLWNDDPLDRAIQGLRPLAGTLTGLAGLGGGGGSQYVPASLLASQASNIDARVSEALNSQSAVGLAQVRNMLNNVIAALASVPSASLRDLGLPCQTCASGSGSCDAGGNSIVFPAGQKGSPMWHGAAPWGGKLMSNALWVTGADGEPVVMGSSVTFSRNINLSGVNHITFAVDDVGTVAIDGVTVDGCTVTEPCGLALDQCPFWDGHYKHCDTADLPAGSHLLELTVQNQNGGAPGWADNPAGVAVEIADSNSNVVFNSGGDIPGWAVNVHCGAGLRWNCAQRTCDNAAQDLNPARDAALSGLRTARSASFYFSSNKCSTPAGCAALQDADIDHTTGVLSKAPCPAEGTDDLSGCVDRVEYLAALWGRAVSVSVQQAAQPPVGQSLIYGWESAPLHGTARGTRHVVKIEAALPTRCNWWTSEKKGDLAKSCVAPGLPWVKTDASVLKRCYFLANPDGNVKVRITRYDEERDQGVIGFMNGIGDLWRVTFTHPDRAGMPKVKNMEACFSAPPRTRFDIRGRNGNPDRQYFVPGAFMINRDSDYEQKYGMDCKVAVETALLYGTTTEVCAQYYLEPTNAGTGLKGPSTGTLLLSTVMGPLAFWGKGGGKTSTTGKYKVRFVPCE